MSGSQDLLITGDYLAHLLGLISWGWAACVQTFRLGQIYLFWLLRSLLTHWGRVTHIWVGNLTIIGPDNSLSPCRRQAIIWTSAGLLLIGPLGTNFSEILIEILTFSFKKTHLEVSSAKRRPLGLNVLTLELPGDFARSQQSFSMKSSGHWATNVPCLHQHMPMWCQYTELLHSYLPLGVLEHCFEVVYWIWIWASSAMKDS